jgi:Tol biopolymer transport system component
VLGDPNYAGNDLWSPSISGDGLSLYFAVSVPGFPEQIALATRADRGAPFGTGQSLAPPVNEDISGTPRLSADGLSLYFFSERGGGAGSRDLYAATRRRSDEEFDSVQALSSLNGPDRDHLPWVSADERTIYFVSNRSGVADIFRSTRASVRDEFGPPEAVTELNSPEEDGGVSLTSDGLTVILSSSRPGGLGGRDLYLATRAIPGEPFSSPEPIAALNTTQNDFDPALSPDERELYFVSNRTGGDTWIYRSLRSCAR